MKYFFGKLLKVETAKDQKTGEDVHRLFFPDEKYDKGLEQMVPCSTAIKLCPEDNQYLGMFQSYVGREIYVPFVETVFERNVFYKTIGQGLKLFEDVTLKSTNDVKK